MYYTTGQITKILNISKPTLYKLCKEKNINPRKTAGGNYRFSEIDLRQLLGESEVKNIEQSFVKVVNDVWLILKNMAEEIWGVEGEKRLIEILKKNKDNIFILNKSIFKEF